MKLPRTAKDVFKFTLKEKLLYNSTIAFYKLTGLWRYPIPTSGDIETMTRKDIIYWIYKSMYPVTKAVKNSGLEEFFKQQSKHHWSLPIGFTPNETLKLSAVGDLMDHPFLPNSADSLYNEVVDTIFDSDISMANLECVVFASGGGAFEIKSTESPPLYYKLDHFNAAKGTQKHQYTFLATAGNHSLDCGEAGVLSTIHALRAEGIAFHGMNETKKETHVSTLIEKKGFKIAVISHTFGLNAKKPPQDKPWIVNRANLNGDVHEIDFSTIEKQIKHARENKADLIIAQLHWGLEHEYYPRPEQLDVAHHLAEMGIDLLIGHHPHVIQPVEYYRTKRDPDRIVPIFYSLGNLLTPFTHPEFCRSGVAKISIAKGKTRDGITQTYVSSAKQTEVFQEIDEKNQKLRIIEGAQVAHSSQIEGAQVAHSSKKEIV